MMQPQKNSSELTEGNLALLGDSMVSINQHSLLLKHVQGLTHATSSTTTTS
jgi:hypothetical protein